MFAGLTKRDLEVAEFKEDSVRELIIAPMFAKLGYPPTGITRVVRSKSLKHPFIRVGTRNHPVTTIPDYTLLHEDKPLFVLDAKAPTEDILDPVHIQQAYSYAIHPEIKCREFGLCNGKQLVFFSVDRDAPLLVVNFDDFEKSWPAIEKQLSLKYLLEPAFRDFAPDLGMKLVRLGLAHNTDLVMLGVRLSLFAKVQDDLMTASANCEFGDVDHCVSFDFPPTMLPQIVAGLPVPLGERFIEALSRAPFQAAAGLTIELDITAKLGNETQGEYESFVPLEIQAVHESRFNPAPVDGDPEDIPSHIFQLRQAFTLRAKTDGNA